MVWKKVETSTVKPIETVHNSAANICFSFRKPLIPMNSHLFPCTCHVWAEWFELYLTSYCKSISRCNTFLMHSKLAEFIWTQFIVDTPSSVVYNIAWWDLLGPPINVIQIGTFSLNQKFFYFGPLFQWKLFVIQETIMHFFKSPICRNWKLMSILYLSLLALHYITPYEQYVRNIF